MSWYTRTMPTVKDVTPIFKDICAQVKSFPSVKNVYIWGSLKEHLDNPSFILRDIDIIADTSFDSGDLMAIDTGRYSPLGMKPCDLEDEGFCPQAVDFTKKYISLQQYNVDHWAISTDKRLLHWGAIPETSEEWLELHTQAEKVASEDTGIKRIKLSNCAENVRKEWKNIYDAFIRKNLSARSGGWFASEDEVESILAKALKIL